MLKVGLMALKRAASGPARGWLLSCFLLAACASVPPGGKPDPVTEGGHRESTQPTQGASGEPSKAALVRPVAVWRDGHPSGEVDLTLPRAAGEIVLDVGEDWAPYIFSERSNTSETPIPQTYRATYLALARGEYPNDHHGARAKVDRYLELYGIPPTLTLLRARFREAQKADCASKVDLEPLKGYQRIIAYVDNPKARRDSAQFLGVEQRMKGLLAKQGVDAPSKLDPAKLAPAEKSLLKTYEKVAPSALVIRAAQSRLKCEGFFEGKASYTDGALDWTTNEAIALFERKHRVFGWGFLSRDTVDALKEPPLEGERQSVIARAHRAGHARRGLHRRRELFGQR